MSNNGSVALGSRARPYQLHRSADQYRDTETNSIFSFSRQEIERAERQRKPLGIVKYRPEAKDTEELEIPPNSYVECHLIQDGIHDESYYNMKKLGQPTPEKKRQVVTITHVEPERRRRLLSTRAEGSRRAVRRAAAKKVQSIEMVAM